MKEVAYIFPGQGAQYVGMGKELCEGSEVARNIFQKANEVLGFDLTQLCFQGPEEDLKATINCQPAIFTLSIASLESLRSNGKSKNLKPKFMAGLSLGEYSALVAAGSFSFEDGLKVVRQRAEFMEEEAGKNPGKMAAIIGLDIDKVSLICSSCGVQIANLNCPGQIVISGKGPDIDKAVQLANDQGAKKVVLLEVNGAFHSVLMNEAGKKLDNLLQATEIKEPNPPVISNFTAKPEIVTDEIRTNLIQQVSAPVRWEDSVRHIVASGIKDFLEIGPSKVLKGMLRRIDSDLTVHNIEKPQDIEDLNL